MHIKVYDVVFAGNYTKDTIITPDGSRTIDGGGMGYGAHAAKRLGLNPAVVTRLSMEDSHVVQGFMKAGIDCYPVFSPSSTCLTLAYKSLDVDQREIKVKSNAGVIQAQYLAGLAAKAVAVSPSFRGEVEPEFFSTLRKQGNIILAVDVQGFVRVLYGDTLQYEPWPEMECVLPEIDILKTDALEALTLTGENDIEKAAAALTRMGAKEIVCTHAEGLLVHAQGHFHHYKFHSKSQAGRSGRGDTCLGAYTSKRLSLPPREAGKWAAAVTSLKVEKSGPFDGSIPEVENYINRYYTDG